MEKLTSHNSRAMTIAEVANVFDVTTKTIRKYVDKLFPDHMNHGVTTYLTETQVTAVKLELEKNHHLNRSVSLPKTELEEMILIQQAQELLGLRIHRLKEQNRQLQLEIQEQKPKAESFDTFIDSDGLSDMSQTAKLLGTGRNRMMNILRGKSILMSNNTPFQQYVNSGYFEVKKIVKNGKNFNVSLCTPKGVDYIRKQLHG